MVTSPIKRKDKADTLVVIEPNAVVDKISGCGLPSGLTNLHESDQWLVIKTTKTRLKSVVRTIVAQSRSNLVRLIQQK